MKLTRYHVVTPPLRSRTGDLERVVFATRTGEVWVMDDSGWRALEAGRHDLLPVATQHRLGDLEMLVPDDEDELATVVGRHHAASVDPATLYLVVQPTAACQLGCDYCGQVHSPRQLSVEDQDAFVAHARTKLERGGYERLSIGWFGAEPLLGLGVIRSLTPRLRRVAADAGVSYTAKTVTNGLALSRDVASELVHELGVQRIEVTLDGTQAHHDQRRHRKQGGPTFDRIFANVVDLARRDDVDAILSIRCNVDRRNAVGVSALLRLLVEAGIQDRIRFYLAPIHSWGNDAHRVSFTAEEYGDLEAAWMAEMFELGFSPALVPGLRPVVCMAVQDSAMLVDAYGTTFTCSEVSYVPTYGEPNRHATGRIASAKRRRIPVNQVPEPLKGFNDLIGAGSLPCSTCRMLPVCGGSCPKEWSEGRQPCPSAKSNMVERLMLLYTRAQDELGESSDDADLVHTG